MSLSSLNPYPLRGSLPCFDPCWWGARAAYIVRSSRFIDCHRRVSIINHLHCNRTAPRSDIEAPGRFSASAYNSRTAKSFQSTTPWRQWKCVVLQSAAIYPIRQAIFARRNPSVRDTRDYGGGLTLYALHRVAYALHHTLQWMGRCVCQTAIGNDFNNMYVDLPRLR